jgi:hypothetical protein
MRKFIKKLAWAALATITLSSLTAFQRAEAASLVSLAGDEDCFGTNRIPCSNASVNEIIANREPDDGVFDSWDLFFFQWSHEFTLPTVGNITNAVLTISTLDVEDAGEGDGLGGAPYNERLFIDGVEVAGAFDTTFTPVGGTATQLPINTVVFNLDASFFPSFLDGRIDVSVNPFGGRRRDAIAIDFAKLELTTSTPIPESSSVLSLLALGILGAGITFIRKLKA